LICIIIEEESIQEKKQAIVKNNEEEREFINKLRNRISYIDMLNISNQETLEELTQEFTSTTEELEYKYSKNVNIIKHSKVWWTKECNRDLTKY